MGTLALHKISKDEKIKQVERPSAIISTIDHHFNHQPSIESSLVLKRRKTDCHHPFWRKQRKTGTAFPGLAGAINFVFCTHTSPVERHTRNYLRDERTEKSFGYQCPWRLFWVSPFHFISSFITPLFSFIISFSLLFWVILLRLIPLPSMFPFLFLSILSCLLFFSSFSHGDLVFLFVCLFLFVYFLFLLQPMLVLHSRCSPSAAGSLIYVCVRVVIV